MPALVLCGTFATGDGLTNAADAVLASKTWTIHLAYSEAGLSESTKATAMAASLVMLSVECYA